MEPVKMPLPSPLAWIESAGQTMSDMVHSLVFAVFTVAVPVLSAATVAAGIIGLALAGLAAITVAVAALVVIAPLALTAHLVAKAKKATDETIA